MALPQRWLAMACCSVAVQQGLNSHHTSRSNGAQLVVEVAMLAKGPQLVAAKDITATQDGLALLASTAETPLKCSCG
eukprot:SAG31_NODE_5166_length_2704_cov_2.110940_4_plen_77_part_00